MLLFGHNKSGSIDYWKLRNDMADDARIESTVTGEFGLYDMHDILAASDDELLSIAMSRGVNVERYRK